MNNHSSDNKRITKNTLLLYLRMMFIMVVGLFTSRVILQNLGVSDFGIYNVVGGVVTLFTFVNSAMTSATQRYITFALGLNDERKLSTSFCTSLNIHAILSVLLIVAAETIGLWFLNNKMTIPGDRLYAANWVYQFSILSTVVMMMSTPYNALIIAHEKMSAFSYISIVEVALKLIIVYCITLTKFDKLIVYSALILIVQLLIRFIYTFYCSRHFIESKYHFFFDKTLFKEMLYYSIWSLWGNLAFVLTSQGCDIILNMFFGPVLNASRGVAGQVRGAILGFSSNFQMAVNPQITKNYAKGDLIQMHRLIYASTKFSFFLLFCLSLPVFIEAPKILSIWLTVVPDHTINFLRIMLCITIINAMSGPLSISAQANGNIRKYQLIVGGILLLTVPVAYISLIFIKQPELVFFADLSIATIAQCVRLYMMRKMINLSLREYCHEVVLKIALVGIMSSVLPVSLHLTLPHSLVTSVIICLVSLLSVIIFVYLIGLNVAEKKFVMAWIRNHLPKRT